jgi:hypothetical protein
LARSRAPTATAILTPTGSAHTYKLTAAKATNLKIRFGGDI